MKANVKSPGYVIAFAAAVSAAFTAAIMTLHVATAARVRQNEALDEARALAELFFAARELARMDDAEIIRQVERRVASRRMEHAGFTLYTAYDWDKSDAKSRITGRGFNIEGVGFWAPITGVLALKPDLSEITGVVFLRHSETPGLGGRITEPQFRRQFRGLLATPPPAGGKFIFIGGPPPADEADPRHRRHVDAITGATGTCTAVERFLNEDLKRFRAAAERQQLVDRPASASGED